MLLKYNTFFLKKSNVRLALPNYPYDHYSPENIKVIFLQTFNQSCQLSLFTLLGYIFNVINIFNIFVTAAAYIVVVFPHSRFVFGRLFGDITKASA
jgi:hypothetical protein